MGTTLISTAKVCGTKHTQCEDSVMYRRRRKWHIVALSDGAGSAKESATGSAIAVHTVVSVMPMLLKKARYSKKDMLNGSFALRLSALVIQQIQKRVRAKALQPLKEFAATLLVGVYHETLSRWIVLHMGDGVIGGVDFKERLHVISKPLNGEFANETFFVTDPKALQNMRVYLLKGLKGITMMSDGTAHTFYSKFTNELASGIKQLFLWQESLGEREMGSVLRDNLRQLALKKTDDDCSIALAQISKKSDENFKKTVLKDL
jgi:hypothetical protein